MHIEAEFDVIGWEPTPYGDSSGPVLSRVSVRKNFNGDLEGRSSAELLMCQADSKDYAAGAGYVGSELVEGKLAGKSGSFVIQHGGIMGPGVDEPTISGNIVPGSGTGELSGLRGSVTITQSQDGQHRISLDIDFRRD
jgi:hypothetical protein